MGFLYRKTEIFSGLTETGLFNLKKEWRGKSKKTKAGCLGAATSVPR